MQKPRQVGGAHAQRPRPVLIDIEVHHLARFFPVQVHVYHVRVFAHLGRRFTRQRPDFFDVFAGHPELHRIPHRRAVFQTGDPRPHRGELLVQGINQPGAQAFAVFNGLGQHHKLGKAGSRQLLVQRQVKARRTGARVGHVVLDAGVILEQVFQAFDLLRGVAQRSAFSQLQVDHQFKAAGGREELLRDKLEQHHRTQKQQHGQRDHGFAAAYAPLHQTSNALIKRCAIRVRSARAGAVFGGMQLGQIRQQQRAQIRHEHHGSDPRS